MATNDGFSLHDEMEADRVISKFYVDIGKEISLYMVKAIIDSSKDFIRFYPSQLSLKEVAFDLCRAAERERKIAVFDISSAIEAFRKFREVAVLSRLSHSWKQKRYFGRAKC